MKNLLTYLFTIACLLITKSSLAEAKLRFESEQISDGLYMLYGVGGFTGGNIGLLVGDDGVAIIDNGLPNVIDELEKTLVNLAGKHADYLINTHIHGDHTGNNKAFGEKGTVIVSHDNLRQFFIEKGIRGANGYKKAPKDALPVITFSDALTLNLNEDKIFVKHMPTAHTSGDAIIVFQHANVIHTGDLFFNFMFPFIDYASGGSLDGYIEAQKHIAALANDETKIIPGHGKLASKADIEQSISMLEDAKDKIAKLVNKKMTLDEVKKAAPLKAYHDTWSWGFISTEKMTEQVYKGLTESHWHK